MDLGKKKRKKKEMSRKYYRGQFSEIICCILQYFVGLRTKASQNKVVFGQFTFEVFAKRG